MRCLPARLTDCFSGWLPSGLVCFHPWLPACVSACLPLQCSTLRSRSWLRSSWRSTQQTRRQRPSRRGNGIGQGELPNRAQLHVPYLQPASLQCRPIFISPFFGLGRPLSFAHTFCMSSLPSNVPPRHPSRQHCCNYQAGGAPRLRHRCRWVALSAAPALKYPANAARHLAFC